MAGDLTGYRNSVLAQLGNEEALQRQLKETPKVDILNNGTTNQQQSVNILHPEIQDTQYNTQDMKTQALNTEVETGLGTRLEDVMSDSEKQKYLNSLSEEQYNQMLQYKNEGYGFMASKALLENSHKLANPTATGLLKYNDYDKKDAYYNNTWDLNPDGTLGKFATWLQGTFGNQTPTEYLANWWNTKYGEKVEKGEETFLDRFGNLTFGTLINLVDSGASGAMGIIDKGSSKLNAKLDRDILGLDTDNKFYREMDTNLASDIAKYVGSAITLAALGKLTVTHPLSMLTFNVTGSTGLGDKAIDLTIGNIARLANWTLDSIPGIRAGYRQLDDKGKEALVNVATLGILHGLGKYGAPKLANTKVGNYVGEVKTAVRKSLERGVKQGVQDARIQADVERQAGTKQYDYIDPETGESGRFDSFEGYDRWYKERIAQAGIRGFREGFWDGIYDEFKNVGSNKGKFGDTIVGNNLGDGTNRQNGEPEYNPEGGPQGDGNSGGGNNNVNGNNNKGFARNVKSTIGESQLATWNRMTKGEINKFFDRYGQSYTQWLIDRGFINSYENNIQPLINYAQKVQADKESVLKTIPTRYVDARVNDMLREVLKRAEYIKDPDLPKIQNLVLKNSQGGLTLLDTDWIRKRYGDNIRTGFYSDNNSKEIQRADNIYYRVQEFLEQKALENGFEQLKELNKEISAAYHIIINTTKRANGIQANQQITLKEAIILAGAMSNPKTRPIALFKMMIRSASIKDKVLKILLKGKTPKEKKELKIDFEKIIKAVEANQEAEAQKQYEEFIKKWNIDTQPIENALGYDPEVGEFVDYSTPTMVTPEGQSKRYGQILETSKGEIKQPGTTKPAEKIVESVVNELVREGVLEKEVAETVKQNLLDNLSQQAQEKLAEVEQKIENGEQLMEEEKEIVEKVADAVEENKDELIIEKGPEQTKQIEGWYPTEGQTITVKSQPKEYQPTDSKVDKFVLDNMGKTFVDYGKGATMKIQRFADNGNIVATIENKAGDELTIAVLDKNDIMDKVENGTLKYANEETQQKQPSTATQPQQDFGLLESQITDAFDNGLVVTMPSGEEINGNIFDHIEINTSDSEPVIEFYRTEKHGDLYDYSGSMSVKDFLDKYGEKIKKQELKTETKYAKEEDKVAKFKEKTNKYYKPINGETPAELEDKVKTWITDRLLEDGGYTEDDFKIVDIAVSGSRARGLEKPNSDLDIVVEFEGNKLREDDLFNILNDEKFEYEGVEVDINPILTDLGEYLENTEKYLSEKSQQQQQKTEKVKDNVVTAESVDDLGLEKQELKGDPNLSDVTERYGNIGDYNVIIRNNIGEDTYTLVVTKGGKLVPHVRNMHITKESKDAYHFYDLDFETLKKNLNKAINGRHFKGMDRYKGKTILHDKDGNNYVYNKDMKKEYIDDWEGEDKEPVEIKAQEVIGKTDTMNELQDKINAINSFEDLGDIFDFEKGREWSIQNGAATVDRYYGKLGGRPIVIWKSGDIGYRMQVGKETDKIVDGVNGKEVVDEYGTKIDPKLYGYIEQVKAKLLNADDEQIKSIGQIKETEYNSDNLQSNTNANETKGIQKSNLGGASEETSGGVQGGDSTLSSAEEVSGTSTMIQSGRSSTDSNKVQGANDSNATSEGFRPERKSRSDQRLNNKQAKEILEKHNYSKNPNDYTVEELEIFKNYEGAGGLTNKGEDTTGVLDQYYTPQVVVNKTIGLAEKYMNKKDTPLSMLEPTGGTGRMIKDGYDVTLFEIDKVPGTIAQILNPNANVIIDDFQNLFMDFTGKRPQEYTGKKFDLIVGNPPYKDRLTAQRANGEEPDIKRFEDYVMKKSVVDLNGEGDVTAMVMPSTFLDKPSNYAKEEILKVGTLVDAYRLPSGVFANTNVGTDIVIFKRDMSGSKAINNGEWFKEHPEKVLGVEKTRIGRHGEETYIDGGENPLSQLDRIVIDTEKVAEQTKETTGIQRQSGKSNSKVFTNTILDIIESNGGLDSNGYLKVESEGFEPLVINMLRDNQVSIAQYYIQNGDVMYDPEIVFEITKEGRLNPQFYRNDGLGIYDSIMHDNDPFLKTRADNLTRFIKKTPEEKVEEYAKAVERTEQVESKPKAKRTRTVTAKRTPTESVIKGDKEDLESKTIAVGEVPEILLEYQRKTNVDGYVEGVDPESDIKNLNYYMGNAQVNDLYFAGNIYDKLDQLELDKEYMTTELYEKQKKGLKEVLPNKYRIEDIIYDPMDKELMETETEKTYETTDRNSPTREQITRHMTIEDEFMKYIDSLPYGSGLRTREARKYLRGQKMEKDTKNETIELTKEFFNKFIREELDDTTKEKLVDKYNRSLRNYVRPKYEDMPLVLSDISKTFRGEELKLLDGQIRGINFLLSKGAGLVAHGVGHGKTMEGIVATVTSMNRGWSKRPLFIVPAPTLNDTWIGTIKELYPTKEIVNLGGLTTADRKRLIKDLGPDPRNWIKDGQLGIITHDGFSQQLDFKPVTKDQLTQELKDVMEGEKDNVSAQEKMKEKIEMIIAGTAKTRKATPYTYTLPREFLKEMYEYMYDMDYENFKKKFVEDARAIPGWEENTTIEEQAEEMWKEKPVLIEDLGIDLITIDEAHNMKNIFAKAKMPEIDETGNKEINRFGDIVGSSSAIGRKAYMTSQYIMKRNNNRNVYLLTATPFNNQPIEAYNMLSLVGRKKLDDLGIRNINDFFVKFADFREDLVATPSGTGFKEQRVMKSFANLQELQRLVNEFIDYLGDRPDLIKPRKKLKKVVLRMSEKQQDVQTTLEALIDNQKEKGDVLKGMTKMRLNLISPYLVNGESPTVTDFIEDSPKLKFATEMIKELRAMGNEDGVFIYMPFGTEYHGLLKQGIAQFAGVEPEKIGIINGQITKEQKDKVAEQFRKGEINVLIGGSNTVEGIDLQNKGYITYNTLQGWNPTEITQLNGRIWRQGNFNNEVLEVLPLLENSADIVMMQKREEKESRINNIFEYQGTVFDTTEIDPQEEKLALLTNPFKKADVYMDLETKKIKKKIQTETVKQSELEKLKEKEDIIAKIPEYEEGIEKSKLEGNEWRTNWYKDMLKKAKADEKWYNDKKAKINVDNLDMAIEESKHNIEVLEGEIQALKDSKESIVNRFEQEALESSKNRKTMKDYIEDLKIDFKNAQRFKTKQELEEWLKSTAVDDLSDAVDSK